MAIATSSTPLDPLTLSGAVQQPTQYYQTAGPVDQYAAQFSTTPPPTGTTTTSGGTTSTVDPSIGAYYDALSGGVQSQLNRLPGQQSIGSQNILDAYNTAYNSLAQNKALADRNYNTSKAQTLQDYVGTRGDIQAGVGQQTNALQQLLGGRGAGNSSAALQGVPYAAARQGSQQNAQVQNTYGRNQQSLDTNYGDFNNAYGANLGDIAHQRDTQQNQLQASIDQNKSSLLAQLAGIAQQRASVQPGATYASVVAAAAPYQAQEDALGGQIDQLGRQYASPVIQNPNPAVYQAPNLASYSYSPQATPTLASAPGAASNLSPFLSVLLNQQKQNTNLAGQQTLATA